MIDQRALAERLPLVESCLLNPRKLNIEETRGNVTNSTPGMIRRRTGAGSLLPRSLFVTSG
jgi:hypothetical protein